MSIDLFCHHLLPAAGGGSIHRTVAKLLGRIVSYEGLCAQRLFTSWGTNDLIISFPFNCLPAGCTFVIGNWCFNIGWWKAAEVG